MSAVIILDPRIAPKNADQPLRPAPFAISTFTAVHRRAGTFAGLAHSIKGATLRVALVIRPAGSADVPPSGAPGG
jgi:hypothetical protein